MMRRALIPHDTCGGAPACGHRDGGPRTVRALVAILCATAFAFLALPATAQESSFPKAPGGILGPKPNIDRAQPLYLQADQLVYDTKNNRVIAQGNVEIYYNNYILTADQVVYDQNVNKLIAEGNAQLKDPNGGITRADRFEALDDFRDAFIQSLSVVTHDDTRIAAERASRREGNVTEYERGKFTPCKNDPGKPPLWCISGARVIHDQNAATVTYQDAQFELFGVPVLYMPYFQHADPSVKRKSGFLIPEISHSSTLGFQLEVPYFFALAPNYDFTFHPMYMATQGVLWQGDWRHRLSFGDINGVYNVKLAGIEQDFNDLPSSTTNRDKLDGWRGSVETHGRFSLSSWWRFGWDVIVESDDSFRRFYKLDSVFQTDRVNSVFLTGISDRNYFSITGYHFGGLLLSDTANSESKVHPIIDWNYVVGQPVLGGELGWNVNALAFSRDLTPTTAGVPRGGTTEINRAVAEVNWRRRFIDPIGQTYTPFAHAHGDIYQLKDTVDPLTLAVIDEETVSRGMAAAGVLYSYPFAARGTSGTHVVEPLVQGIVRTAKVSQKRLPDEDARSLLFDDANLFDLSRFSGYDRLETGTRINVGAQYTFQSNAGGSARILAGQSFHMAGENPYLNPFTGATQNINGVNVPVFTYRDADGKPIFTPSSGLETSRSDYVLGVYLAPSSIFKAIAQARFDEKDLALRRTDVYGSFNYGPISLQANYAFASADPLLGIPKDQQDITAALGLKLTEQWSILGSIRYDIDEGFRFQDSLQLRYSDECFVLTATYSETFINDPTRDIVPDRSIMLRFELKHLGEFRYKTDQLDNAFFGENQPKQ